MRKGNDFMRGVMMREQAERDGKQIAHLSAAMRWLARQLALLGVRPCPRMVQDASGEAVEDMTREWLAAGHRAAESAGRRVSG